MFYNMDKSCFLCNRDFRHVQPNIYRKHIRNDDNIKGNNQENKKNYTHTHTDALNPKQVDFWTPTATMNGPHGSLKYRFTPTDMQFHHASSGRVLTKTP